MSGALARPADLCNPNKERRRDEYWQIEKDDGLQTRRVCGDGRYRDLFGVFAQTAQQVPDPSQAPVIVRALDTAADDGMRQNLAFFDGNSDGGIDAEELERVLTILQGQTRATPGDATTGAVRPPDGLQSSLVDGHSDRTTLRL